MLPELSDSHRFIQARAIIQRMLEDWPYQPPEIVEPEREAFRQWLQETRPEPAEYIAALRQEAEQE